VLILSDFLAMQKAVHEELKDYGFLRFSTSWNDDQRREAFEMFQEDPETKGMVAGTRAVSEGVDFSEADTVICTDLLWSPTFQSQSWSRILAPTPRKRDCEIYLMLSQNTIDEYMYTVFYSKLMAAEQAMDRKILNRRAMDVDIKWFAERVLEEEFNLTTQLRDFGVDESQIVLPDMNEDLWESRAV
jgi:SNF2 family DNA or RNA helicase